MIDILLNLMGSGVILLIILCIIGFLEYLKGGSL